MFHSVEGLSLSVSLPTCRPHLASKYYASRPDRAHRARAAHARARRRAPDCSARSGGRRPCRPARTARAAGRTSTSTPSPPAPEVVRRSARLPPRRCPRARRRSPPRRSLRRDATTRSCARPARPCRGLPHPAFVVVTATSWATVRRLLRRLPGTPDARGGLLRRLDHGFMARDVCFPPDVAIYPPANNDRVQRLRY